MRCGLGLMRCSGVESFGGAHSGARGAFRSSVGSRRKVWGGGSALKWRDFGRVPESVSAG